MSDRGEGHDRQLLAEYGNLRWQANRRFFKKALPDNLPRVDDDAHPVVPEGKTAAEFLSEFYSCLPQGREAAWAHYEEFKRNEGIPLYPGPKARTSLRRDCQAGRLKFVVTLQEVEEGSLREAGVRKDDVKDFTSDIMEGLDYPESGRRSSGKAECHQSLRDQGFSCSNERFSFLYDQVMGEVSEDAECPVDANGLPDEEVKNFIRKWRDDLYREEVVVSSPSKSPGPTTPEQLKGLYFPVLDHGFVALVDYMGDDGAIEQAARVSYGKGTRKVSKTRGLIRYLMRHRHTTPFEQVELKFHCAMPLFVARQWVRHRTASLNEYSGRYSVMPDALYIPPEERFGAQDRKNRQGTDIEADPGMEYESFVMLLRGSGHRAFQTYDRLLDGEVARELARVGLPLNAYTEWYWKIDLHNLFHFLSLRLDPHAQWEIRRYAQVMSCMTRAVVPLAMEAFVDYQLCGERMSRGEMEVIRSFIDGEDRVEVSHITDEYWLDEELEEEFGLSPREVRELKAKLEGEDPTPYELSVADAVSPEEARERLHGSEEDEDAG